MSSNAILIAVYVITALDVLVAAGFATAGITMPERVTPGPITESSQNFAFYAAVRAIPLAVVVLAAILLHATEAVFWLGLLAGIIQLGDAWVGVRQGDRGKIIGPLVLAVLQFGALYALRQTGAI